MCRIILAALIGLFCFGPDISAVAQTRRIDSPEVLKPLLAMPAPTPRNAKSAKEERPASFFEKGNAPADDAPLEDLVAYWARSASDSDNPQLTVTVRQRLLDFCLSEVDWLPHFLRLMPQTDSAKAKIKEVYDKAQSSEEFDNDWRREVKEWLLLNSTYFLDELLAIAQKTKDKDDYVNNEEELKALAKLHWSGAEPLLRGLIATGQPRSGAVALTLFYQHAIDEKDLSGEERYRRDLQAIALNRNAQAYARNTAILALSKSEWSGRDDWYLSLFQDETLLNLNDAGTPFTYSPLVQLYSSDLDKWIPVMARLVKSDDVNVRSAAASCLMTLDAERPRKDALLPLLPLLSNRSWLKFNSQQRLRLVQILRNVDVPESVPGLISIVEDDNIDFAWERSYAAYSLARYKDPRAAPALRKLLNLEKDHNLRQLIIEGLVASGGLSQAEQVQAVEAYAAKVTTEEGRLYVVRNRTPDEEPLPLQLAIGVYLAIEKTVPESLVSAVLVRAESLASENPPVAKTMIEIAHDWQGNQADLDMIRRIANGSADTKMITRALSRKPQFHESLRGELQSLAAAGGAAQGAGAVLLDDAALAQTILTEKDQPAQIGLLACARLVQMPLPPALVGPFLRSKNPLLALAAEAYLLAEDSREARELLWQHHPNEAFVTGWLETLDYPTDLYTGIRKTEDKMRAELLKEGGPSEILALIPNGQDGLMVLRIYPNKAVFTEYEDSSRYRERTVPKTEVSLFKDFLTTNAIGDRGPTLEWCYEVCPSAEFLAVTKEKGRRVFSRAGFVSQELENMFWDLAAGDGVKTHYELEQEIKGLEVLYASDDLLVNDVWRQGNELRVLLERPETDEEIERREAELDTPDEEDASARLERRRREAEEDRARFSWRVFANNEPGAVTTQPDFYTSFDGIKFITADENDDEEPIDANTGNVQVLSPDTIIITRDYGGMWKHVAGASPVQISGDTGVYKSPIVTRDGKWIIVAKNDESWSTANYIVRYNLQTGREFRVNLEPADEFDPIAFVAAHNKVLLHRAKGLYTSTRGPVGPDRPEYYLLDPATGATRLVTGEFEPLRQNGRRSLQRTEKPNEFWVALPDMQKNRTRIGRYNARDFSFQSIMEVPHIAFDSMSMYVDATQGKIYLVYKGQLVRLPLPAAAN